MKMEKGTTIGNVTMLLRRKQWFEAMSYTELLQERDMLRKEISRVRTAQRTVQKIDPRGIWTPELCGIQKSLSELIEGCQYAIQKVIEPEMIKRMGARP